MSAPEPDIVEVFVVNTDEPVMEITPEHIPKPEMDEKVKEAILGVVHKPDKTKAVPEKKEDKVKIKDIPDENTKVIIEAEIDEKKEEIKVEESKIIKVEEVEDEKLKEPTELKVDVREGLNENDDDHLSPKCSRELKSILSLAKEANLDTNIGYKRKALDGRDTPEVDTPNKKKYKRDPHKKSGGKKSKREPMPIIRLKEDKDAFCWRCHKGNVAIVCATCPRAFHNKCVKSIGKIPWQCPECTTILKAENTKSRSSAVKELSLDMLCILLKFAHKRMIQVMDCDPFFHPVNEQQCPDYREYIINPMDLTKLEKNINENTYGSTVAFEADTKWILHNSVVYNSPHSKYSNIAKMIMKVCRQEMSEIEVCPNCYNNANTKDNWFVEVCSKPHLLLWAKLKGFPYWPAKAMSTNYQGMVDVRFFGAHDRAWVSYKDCYLYSAINPNTTSIKRMEIRQCISEVNEYIENLKEAFGPFKFPPFKSPFRPDKDTIHAFLPKFPGPKKVSFPGSNIGNMSQLTLSKSSLNTSTSSKSIEDSLRDDCDLENDDDDSDMLVIDTSVENITENKQGEKEESPTKSEVSSPTELKKISAFTFVSSNGTGNIALNRISDKLIKKLSSGSESGDLEDKVEEKRHLPIPPLVPITISLKNPELSISSIPTSEPNVLTVVSNATVSVVPSASSSIMSTVSKAIPEVVIPIVPIDHSPESSIDSILSASKKSNQDNSYEENDLLEILYTEPVEGSKRIGKKGVKEERSPENKEKTIDEVYSKLKSKTKTFDKIIISSTPDKSKTEFSKKFDLVNSMSAVVKLNDKVATLSPIDKKRKLSSDSESLTESITKTKKIDVPTAVSALPDITFVDIKEEVVSEDELEDVSAKRVLLNALNISEKGVQLIKPKPQKMTRSKTEVLINRKSNYIRETIGNVTILKKPDKKDSRPSFKSKKKLLPSINPFLPPKVSKKKLIKEKKDKKDKSKTSLTLVKNTKSISTPPPIKPAPNIIQLQKPLLITNQVNPTTSNFIAMVPHSASTYTNIIYPQSNSSINLTPINVVNTGDKTNGTNDTATENNSSEFNIFNGLLSDSSLSKALTDALCNTPPRLKPRPPGPLTTQFEEIVPSVAGPATAQINSIAHRLTDYFRGMLIETLVDVGKSDNAEATIAALKLENETLKHHHKEEILEIKKNVNSILQDIQKSIAEEKEKLVQETRAACELETIRLVEEAKTKQWCANCTKEAQFYCCWNTSYCDYPCQTKHWPKHMSKCTQHNTNSNQPSTSLLPGMTGQPIILRHAAPPKFTSQGLLGKTKLLVNKSGNKVPVNIRSSGSSHITLVESTPGNYELLGNGSISVDNRENFNKLIKYPTIQNKIKTGNVIMVSSAASMDPSKTLIIQQNNSPK